MYKSKVHTAWKIIAHPSSPESQWLPACNQVGAALTASVSTRRSPWRSLVLAILASAALSWVGAMVVNVGYDWGYRLVSQLAGQAAEFTQGEMALYSIPYLIMPMLFGLFLGYSKAAVNGSRRWIFACAAVVSIFVAVISLSGGPDDVLKHPVETIMWAVSALSLSTGALLVGENVFASLRARMRRPASVLIPALIFIAPLAAIGANSTGNLDLRMELAFYAGAIAIGSAFAVRLSRVKRSASAVSVGLVAVLPVILANLLNVGGNLASLVLDSCHLGAGLGWRALLSALLIFSVALISSLSGSVAARRLSSASER